MLRKRTIALLAGATVAIALVPWQARADQVIADDLIVQGSICAGFDCVNGESFGFDTIRMKENNTRLHFLDTSTSASFPQNDWRVTANDSSNGGDNYLGIEDATASRRIVTFEAGARTHALYLDAGGDLGLGTDTPVADVHIKTGNTPTLRLEQDGSSGFTAQTWDVAGNEANFFVRDATNGSTLPFRIEPGAPSNALYIEDSGEIGLGTTSPGTDLDIVDAGPVGIEMNNTVVTPWEFRVGNAGNWVVNENPAGLDGDEFVVLPDGTVQILGACIEFNNGANSITAAGVQGVGCP